VGFKPEALLRKVFPDLDDASIEETIFLARVRTYESGATIVKEGEEGDVFFIIGEGSVNVFQMSNEGERLLRQVATGGYFGEMALIANTPRNATVRAAERTTVIEIDKPAFMEMLRQNPPIALSMFNQVVDWMRNNDRSMIDMLNHKQRELETAYAALKRAEQQRSEFLTLLAHEMRTPLTSASGFMQLIRGGSMSGPVLQMSLEKVGVGLDRMVSLVNDLFFVQEMDLITPVLRATNVNAIVKAVVEDLEDKADDNDLKIALQIADGLPEIQADPDGLTRAFNALLDNAIKFSPEGGTVGITVEVQGSHMRIAIADPGIGIAPDMMPRIFERFSHQDKFGDYVFGGVGLGLPIAKHLIESMGGHIEVESEVGQGSRFTVSLPVLVKSE
jgi:two-component system sensor histidine kinase VicK